MQNHTSNMRCYFFAAAVVVLLSSCGDTAEERPDNAQQRQLLESQRGRAPDLNPSDVHSVKWRVRSVRTEEEGVWSPEFEEGSSSDVRADAVASPRRAFNDNTLWHEAVALQFEATTGISTQEYRVEASPNLDFGSVDTPRPLSPTIIPSEVSAALASDEVTDFQFHVRNFPRWTPPHRASSTATSLADVQGRQYEREQYRSERDDRLTLDTLGLRTELEQHAIEVLSSDITTGSLMVRGPGRVVANILQGHADGIVAVDLPSAVSISLHVLSQSHINRVTGAALYASFGHDGLKSNPNRHNWGRVVAGVVDADPISTNSSSYCWTYDHTTDGACLSANNRLFRSYACDSASCWISVYTSYYDMFKPDDEFFQGPFHGARVASTLLGDTSSGQGCCSDGYIHDGTAKNAGLIYAKLGPAGSGERGVRKLMEEEVDVINLSWGEDKSELGCTVHANLYMMTVLDAAYADGILTVVSGGNFDAEAAESCKMTRPATYPSTLAVTGVDALGPTGYNTANLHLAGSSRGGGSAVLNGTTCTGCYSLVGLGAPASVYWAKPYSLYRSPYYEGSSYAAPAVAGAALSVKDQFLDSGHSWVNSPGRLHTIMLAMGDRRPSAHGVTSSTGASDLWGFGRLRLRLFESGGGLGSYG